MYEDLLFVSLECSSLWKIVVQKIYIISSCQMYYSRLVGNSVSRNIFCRLISKLIFLLQTYYLLKKKKKKRNDTDRPEARLCHYKRMSCYVFKLHLMDLFDICKLIRNQHWNFIANRLVFQTLRFIFKN